MAWPLSEAKPLPQPITENMPTGPSEQNQVKYDQNFIFLKENAAEIL